MNKTIKELFADILDRMKQFKRVGLYNNPVFNSTSDREVEISSDVANADVGFVATRSDTDTSVELLVGSGGVNHGVFSRKLDLWMIYSNASKTIVPQLYPVNSIFTTATNTNPNSLLGYGTWSLVDKRYAYAWRTDPFTFNTTNTQSSSSAVVLHGNTVECRLAWQNKVAMSDTTITIATINFANHGINAAQHTQYMIGYNDAGNAIGMFVTSWSGATMTIQCYDWVTRATAYPTTTGQSCDLNFVFVVESHTSMVDSLCDEFVWKRTA